MLDMQLWAQGSTTLLIGMGIVFTFLVILIFAIMISAKVVKLIDRLFPPLKEETKPSKKSSTDESEVALAIAVAANKA